MLHWLLVIQATAQNRCIQLPASTPCGSNFQNYPIFDINLEQLNDYVTNQVMDLNNVANALGTNGYCTQVSSLVNSLRYQITLYCASRVNIAIQAGCLSPGNSTTTPVCEKECNIAKDSFVNIIKNGTACPNGQALGGVAQAQSDVCSQAKLSKLKCILSDSEVSTCGKQNLK